MTDLRQGVTPTQHAVLDLIEEMAPEFFSANLDIDEKLALASFRAWEATQGRSLTRQRQIAIEAAARLIDAADEISRLLGPKLIGLKGASQ